jgi:hypothetical protein
MRFVPHRERGVTHAEFAAVDGRRQRRKGGALKGKFTFLFCILAAASVASAAQDTNAGLTRGEMAEAMLRAGEVSGFVPPACVPGSEMFADVPAASPFCSWIEELARRGITGGCGGGNYCPLATVTREQMAVFQVGALTAGGTARAVVTRAAGTLTEGRIGTWAVNRPAASPTGVYCLSIAGVDPATDVAIVTVEWGASLGFDLLAYYLRVPFQCAAGQFEVRTYQFAGGGAPVLSNNIQFLVYIP